VRGNVIGFDRDTNTGAISGHDGNRYDFVRQDWRGQHPPRHGDIVDFQAVEQRATDIYLIEPVFTAPSLAELYFSPMGRISRSQYWLKFFLPYIVLTVALETVGAIGGVDSTLNAVISVIRGLLSLVVLWPSIAILVKRMHDRNKSAWYLLAQFVPSILLVIAACAWLGPTVIAMVTAGSDAEVPSPSLNFAGVSAIVLGVVLFGVAIWFFVEFGCMRGTIGPNRFGPDPVR
jgi:uncharacterized membrane protein YhaH (DUF805 family)